MSVIGHAMVGDTMYGGRTIETPGPPVFKFERQALHAAQITFTHPISLEQMTLSAPLPPDIKTLIQTLRAQA